MFARVEPFHKSKIVGYLPGHFKEMFAGITAILLNEIVLARYFDFDVNLDVKFNSRSLQYGNADMS